MPPTATAPPSKALVHHHAVLRRPHRPAIDELGYLPLPGVAASALFQVVSQRYPKTSIVLTTTRGVASCGEALRDTTVAAAMLDRLLHRCVVLNLDGDSYRLRARTPATTRSAKPPPAPADRYGNHSPSGEIR